MLLCLKGRAFTNGPANQRTYGELFTSDEVETVQSLAHAFACGHLLDLFVRLC